MKGYITIVALCNKCDHAVAMHLQEEGCCACGCDWTAEQLTVTPIAGKVQEPLYHWVKVDDEVLAEAYVQAVAALTVEVEPASMMHDATIGTLSGMQVYEDSTVPRGVAGIAWRAKD